jgi:hypothetical protein
MLIAAIKFNNLLNYRYKLNLKVKYFSILVMKLEIAGTKTPLIALSKPFKSIFGPSFTLSWSSLS